MLPPSSLPPCAVTRLSSTTISSSCIRNITLNPAHSTQPGRAPTWCTTTCWPTWTSPAWIRRAAVAACPGQNWPLTFQRTQTMTPSGPRTVTEWAQCHARAASLTRTEDRTVLPSCAVKWSTACLPLFSSMCLKKKGFFNLSIYFLLWFFNFFVNLFVLFIFRQFVWRCFRHLPVAFAISPFMCLLSFCSCHAVGVW